MELIQATSRAVMVRDDGGLELGRVPTPAPVGDEVLVQVAAAGLNRADLFQRKGEYPAPPGSPQRILGVEFSGTVTAVGPRTASLVPGDRVYGIVGGGAEAEHVLTVESHLARVPDHVDLVEAAAVPEVFLTAYDSLFTQARLCPGERVLIFAIGSGVGTAALQLANAAGCTVVGTARSAEKIERARALGLDHGVLVGSQPDAAAIAAEVISATGGADVVLDLVGGPYVAAAVKSAASRARIVLIGRHMAGSMASFDLHDVMPKRLEIRGTVFRSRSLAEKATAIDLFGRHVGALLASGRVRPVIDSVFPMDRVDDAYARLASNETFGKVILSLQ